MSFSPAPFRRAVPGEGEERGGVLRRRRDPGRRVHAAAPASSPSMSIPCSAAGSSPTAESLGGAAADPVPHREAGEPAFAGWRRSSSSLPAAGDGDGVAAEVEPRAPCRPPAASSMPLRVSGVPPDLEMTTASVSRAAGHRDPRPARGHAVRVGVVEEEGAEPVVRRPERVGDELRAERRAADADRRAGSGSAGAFGGAIFPEWTSAANALDLRPVASMAARSAGSGASCGARSQ